MSADVRLIASKDNWIETKAVDQLNGVGALPGMVRAVGMPDLHPGKGSPVGAAFACHNRIYPHLVGNDIGCGMTLWQTDLNKSKIRMDKWLRRLESLEEDALDDAIQFLAEHGADSGGFERSLGTIGGGNHFAELQKPQQICNEELFSHNGFNADALFVLVHSGSRGLGEKVLRAHTDQHGAGGLQADGEEAEAYMSAHNKAMQWASVNRKFIGTRFLSALATSGTCMIDLHHNFVERVSIAEDDNCWLHRKGACPSDRGLVVIPGSRGTLTYLLQPIGDQTANLRTLAHGAGRKWNRSDCRGRLEKKYSRDSFLKTELGGRLICTDKNLLYEEAPQAYKDVDIVVQDLIDEGLVAVVATLAPVITFKTADTAETD
ncbi:MAG: RNA ligase RtcB family protein [Candidatus Obscuribacterales bacterium]|nr:RNA ligase RtcB family protein [Candidatus Obscuribacterales bacterium]